MLRLNLSTRPFYNEGLVHLLLGLATVVLLLGLVISGRDVVRLTTERGALSSQVSATDRALAAIETNRRALEAKARQADLEALRRSASEANEVIAARAFPWTALLNDVAERLPPGVRLLAVKPTRTDAETTVAMIVRARSNAEVEEFLTQLEQTGRFRAGLVRDGELDDDGTLRMTLSIQYTTGSSGQGAPREGVAP